MAPTPGASVYQASKKYNEAVNKLRGLTSQRDDLQQGINNLTTPIAHAEAEVNKTREALLKAASESR